MKPVNLDTLQKLSSKFIDVHSQFQNHSIIKEEYQIEILDLLAKNQNLIENYKKSNFSLYKECEKIEDSRDFKVRYESTE